MDISDITDFLPKYPNIVQSENDLLNPYKDDFYESIYNKKEFYDEKLEPIENVSSEPGNLLKHQKIIARFFSSYTPYNELLLLHAMGTGKSCSAVGAIEHIKEAGGFRGALYLAKGDALINNFRSELIFKCTGGQYIPQDYDDLTQLEKVHRRKKATRDFYQFNTFETFAKQIKGRSDDILQKKYDNFIIIIDEVHNLRIQNKTIGLNIYNEFLHFLHTIRNCKILLLSGTPMKDDVDEFASVMNLLLPPEDALPTGEEFITTFFTPTMKVKPSMIPILKQKLKGRVSYLKAMESSVPKIFEGVHMGTLKHLLVVPDIMSNFQTLSYQKAHIIDTKNAKKGVYSHSRQASLFVFPDGSYGKDGFNTYVTKGTKTGKNIYTIGENGKKQKLQSFTLSSTLRKDLIHNDKILDNLSKYSTMYTASIRNILEAKKQGKCVFVYNEFVEGSGIILFGLILELFGFSKARGSEAVDSHASRYASLTSLTTTTSQIQDLVTRFNQPDNIYGEVIQVIIGSRKISEGFSFKNIQIEEIQTPWYNYSETDQAIARGSRLGSHRMLIEAGNDPKLQIYQRVAIPDPKVMPSSDSIDLRMYEISETKDINIKGMERIIKEASFDCALNYNRNAVTGMDGKRDCEYMDCLYTCDGIDFDKPVHIDYSTYQLYYNNNSINNIIDRIKILFRDIFTMDLNTISGYFTEYTHFELLTALRKIINENIVIKNKYGFASYLQEEYNIYFLVDNLSVMGTFSSDYYTQYPHIKRVKTFKQIIKPIYIAYLPQIVNRLTTAKSMDDIRNTISKLPLSINEFLLESALLAQQRKIDTNIPLRNLILKYFNRVVENIDGVTVSQLLYEEEEGILRCLKDGVWSNCPNTYIDLLATLKEQVKDKLITNPYGFYGQHNPELDTFCIRDVRDEIPDKKNQRTSGKICINWVVKDLYDLALNILDMPLPADNVVRQYMDQLKAKKRDIKHNLNDLTNRDNLWNVISNLKIIKDMYKKDDLTAHDMVRIIYWGSMQKKTICPHIQAFFAEKGFLDVDTGCGKVGSLKI